MSVKEYNFDGLVGPTHNYAGLALGNLAATEQQYSISRPKLAAQQGLKKMKIMMDLGLPQGVILPHYRPHLSFLKSIGFSGRDDQILKDAFEKAPRFFAASYSASSMWTANMATVAPSRDTEDGKVHFTAANLVCNVHRALEANFSSKLLHAIFKDDKHFVHHEPLPFVEALGDEGAANHSRLAVNHEVHGTHFFVYGRVATDPTVARPRSFPARQTFEASSAVARMHLLNHEHVVFAQQNPDVIDLGVFHNDVICVANENVMLYHEKAFMNKDFVIQDLKKHCPELYAIEVKEAMLTVPDCVKSYLFNSQLVTLDDGSMMLVSPRECLENPIVTDVIEQIVNADNPIKQAITVDCLQSMQNGGGPACLRLRVLLNETEVNAMHQGVLYTEELHNKLNQWVEKHYRDELSFDDLLDPNLITETEAALDELTQITGLGSVYEFQ